MKELNLGITFLLVSLFALFHQQDLVATMLFVCTASVGVSHLVYRIGQAPNADDTRWLRLPTLREWLASNQTTSQHTQVQGYACAIALCFSLPTIILQEPIYWSAPATFLCLCLVWSWIHFAAPILVWSRL